MSDTYETVRSALTATFRIPEDELHPHTTLRQLDMDSLALAEFALVLEERLGVKIQSEHATGDTTLAAVAEHLHSLLTEPTAAR
ncbi:acyl carrier protein [Streptomyces flavofungini]|uniref:acyl carrier protein n=1 Tax=Streptomyces flavofungini TaxID=68200 RepID=UPI0034DE973F